MSRLWPTSEVKTELLRRAMSALGLELTEKSNHTDVLQVHTGKKTQIPRHKVVKRELARAIVRFVVVGMGIPEEKVRKALKTDLPILPEEKS